MAEWFIVIVLGIAVIPCLVILGIAFLPSNTASKLEDRLRGTATDSSKGAGKSES